MDKFDVIMCALLPRLYDINGPIPTHVSTLIAERLPFIASLLIVHCSHGSTPLFYRSCGHEYVLLHVHSLHLGLCGLVSKHVNAMVIYPYIGHIKVLPFTKFVHPKY